MATPSSKVECIYCRAELTPVTKKAHVWPASLGGRLSARTICCDGCNNAISTAEDKLRASLQHAYAAVGATNDEREPFSVQVEYHGNDFILSDGNADLITEGSWFDRERKCIIVPLPAGLDNQAAKMAKALWRQGLGVDDVGKVTLEPGDEGPVLPDGPTWNEHDLSVGGAIEHKRTFVKMALELLAYHRHDVVMRGELSEARRFARYGTGTFHGKPDLRSAGSGLLPTVGLPEIYNALEAWSFGRTVYFRTIFLGPIGFTGTVTTDWSGSPFRAGYAFDARDPANVLVSTYIDGDGPNLAIWIDDMKDEAEVKIVPALENVSLRLAQSKERPQREASPKIEALRDAIRAVLAKMPPPRKRK